VIAQDTLRGTHSTYPKVAGQWLNQALYFYQSLCLVVSESLRNRHLRVAAARYAQGEGATSSGQKTEKNLLELVN